MMFGGDWIPMVEIFGFAFVGALSGELSHTVHQEEPRFTPWLFVGSTVGRTFLGFLVGYSIYTYRNDMPGAHIVAGILAYQREAVILGVIRTKLQRIWHILLDPDEGE